MKSPHIITAVLLGTFAQHGYAELSLLEVQRSPDLDTYYLGEPINITISSDGNEVQYRYVLELETESGFERIDHSRWSFSTQYTLDTYALNMEPGNYRLRTISREKDNPKEVLVKYKIFSIAGSPLNLCDAVGDATFINPAPDHYQTSLSMSALSNPSFDIADIAYGIESISFSSDTVSITPYDPMNVIVSFMGTYSVTHTTPLQGTYSCNNEGIVTVTTEGVATATGATTVTVNDRISGQLEIGISGSSLISGSTTFITN